MRLEGCGLCRIPLPLDRFVDDKPVIDGRSVIALACGHRFHWAPYNSCAGLLTLIGTCYAREQDTISDDPAVPLCPVCQCGVF